MHDVGAARRRAHQRHAGIVQAILEVAGKQNACTPRMRRVECIADLLPAVENGGHGEGEIVPAPDDAAKPVGQVGQRHQRARKWLREYEQLVADCGLAADIAAVLRLRANRVEGVWRAIAGSAHPAPQRQTARRHRREAAGRRRVEQCGRLDW